MTQNIKPWKILSSDYVLSDDFLTLRTDKCERADGHIVPRYHVIELTPWVTVIPITEEGNILLVREYRHAAGVVMVGLPGGTSDPSETDWELVGRRELSEETGYKADRMEHIGSCYPNPAVQDNLIHYYLALDCKEVSEQDLDPNEEIEVIEMPLEEFLAYEQIEVQHALHAAALYYLERYLAKNPHLRPKAVQE